MVVKDVSNLKFRIIKNEDFEKNRELVESAFDLIYERWTVANRALKINEKVTSDSLLFSDIVGLWDEEECVALTLAKKGYMDGYFSDWSLFELYGEDGIQKIKERGNYVDVWHRTSVSSRWGKNRTNYHLVTILFGLLYKRFQNSKCDLAIGLSNNGLGIDLFADEWGYETLIKKTVHNTTGNILIADKYKEYKHKLDEVNLIVNNMWRKHEEFNARENRELTNITL